MNSESEHETDAEMSDRRPTSVATAMAEDAIPAPSGLGTPRHVHQGPFVQELLPGLESFVDLETLKAVALPPKPAAPTKPIPESGVRVGRLTAFIALLAAIGMGVACVLLFKAACQDSDGGVPVVAVREPAVGKPTDALEIPSELAGDAEGASCWKTIANMHGNIDGVSVAFRGGVATAGETVYRAEPDLCRDGTNVLVKVSGNGIWFVRVAPSGKIQRAYRCRRAGLTARQIVR